VGLEALSPGQKGPVAATWFTGKLKVTQGKILKPAVPPPIYEKDLMIPGGERQGGQPGSH